MSEQTEFAINLGTLESPNYAGSAYAVGRARGIGEALDAVKAVDFGESFDADDAVDLCVAAIEALLAKAVR